MPFPFIHNTNKNTNLLYHLIYNYTQFTTTQYVQEEVMEDNKEAIQSEMFDMVRPIDPYKITLKDLIKRLHYITK